jgi:hypothetical protein|tara:strand:- start:217 stop:534 length:318 start_codon:yes stop_codon:yes gene_type:complete
MSCTELTAKYAPDLLHLAEQLDAFDAVIPSWAAGPVPDAKSNPGGTEPHILLELFEDRGIEAIVMIYGEESCFVHTRHAAPYPITFQGLIKYLEQLPKPLYAFMD